MHGPNLYIRFAFWWYKTPTKHAILNPVEETHILIRLEEAAFESILPECLVNRRTLFAKNKTLLSVFVMIKPGDCLKPNGRHTNMSRAIYMHSAEVSLIKKWAVLTRSYLNSPPPVSDDRSHGAYAAAEAAHGKAGSCPSLATLLKVWWRLFAPGHWHRHWRGSADLARRLCAAGRSRPETIRWSLNRKDAKGCTCSWRSHAFDSWWSTMFVNQIVVYLVEYG